MQRPFRGYELFFLMHAFSLTIPGNTLEQSGHGLSQNSADRIHSIVERADLELEEFKAGLRRLDTDLEELKTVIQEELFQGDERSGGQKHGIYCLDPTGTFSYGGTKSVTRNGRQCQKWSSQTPHEHRFKNDSNFHADGSVVNADNYCRDPDGEGMPWCYTVDVWVRWEHCDIPICNRDCWYGSNSRLYTGTKSVTVTGQKCQDWSAQYPHEHTNAVSHRFPLDGSVQAGKNYCRDPDRSGEPWCYTTDPEIRWEYCDVRCSD